VIYMKHEERIEFAKKYAKKLYAKYKDGLIYFGITGSTYRNEDRDDSDIDAFVVTKDKKHWPESKWLHFMYNGIAVSIGYYTVEELDGTISKPDYKWSHRVFRVIKSLPIYEKYDLIGKYEKAIRKINQQAFNKAASKQLTAAASCLSGIRRNAESGDLAGTRSGATLATTSLDEVVAFLNKGFLPGGGYGSPNLKLIAKYKKIPKDYIRLNTTIWESNDPEEINNAAIELISNTISFAKRNGVEIPKYNSLAKIPV